MKERDRSEPTRVLKCGHARLPIDSIPELSARIDHFSLADRPVEAMETASDTDAQPVCGGNEGQDGHHDDATEETHRDSSSHHACCRRALSRGRATAMDNVARQR
jgi:hypothetical protein